MAEPEESPLLRDEENPNTSNTPQNNGTNIQDDHMFEDFANDQIIEGHQIAPNRRGQNHLPWLLQMYMGFRRLTVILDTILVLCLYASIYVYLEKKDLKIFFIPISVDIGIHVASCAIYYMYKEDFFPGESPENTNKNLFKEVAQVLLKICILLLAVLALNGDLKKPSIVIGWSLFICLIVLPFLKSSVRVLFNSIMGYHHKLLLLTFVLLTLKLFTIWDLSWTWVFIGQLTLGWILFVLMFIIFIAVASIFLCLICAGNMGWLRGGFAFAVTAFKLLMVVETAMFCLALIQAADKKRLTWIPGGLRAVLIFCMVYNLLSAIMNLFVFSEAVYQMDNTVKKKSGLNQALDIVQKTPTLFSAAGDMNDASNEPVKPEECECIICCEKPSNCVIFDCMHSGVCSDCAEAVLTKSSTCMICRQPIKKIAVIKKQAENKYLITDEIYID